MVGCRERWGSEPSRLVGDVVLREVWRASLRGCGGCMWMLRVRCVMRVLGGSECVVFVI